MNDQLLMVFPPGWTPFAPYLALPQLKGYLNHYNLDADIVDENIIFFDSILDENYLFDKCQVLKEKLYALDCKDILSDEEKKLYQRLLKIKLYEERIAHISEYKALLRDSGKKFNKNTYETIMDVFAVALDVVNLCFEQVIDFTDIDYLKYRRDNIEDIENALDDEVNNIFVSYYLQVRASLIDKICRYKILGISVTSVAQLIPALTLCKIIKNKNPNAIIFLGGNYITRLIQQREDNILFISQYVDFVSCYEGEYAIKQLAEGMLSRNKFYKEIKKIYNIIYFENGEIKHSQEKQFEIKDVKCPNFDGFAMNLYFNPILVLPLIGSKNCYSNCAFCTISGGTGGKKYAVMDLNVVYDFMRKLREKYSTRYFTFVDETFTLKKMIELSKLLISDCKNDFLWYTETRFDYPLSESEGKILYEGGLRKLQFGLESYNQRILDLMNKKISLKNIYPILENCMKNGIAFHLFYIIGFPGETREEAIKTIEFVEEILKEAELTYTLNECSKGVSAFGLEKGSRVFNYPKEYGISIIQDSKNDIGIGFNFDIKEGLSETESVELMNSVIARKTCRKGIDISIGRLLGEESSLFFDGQEALNEDDNICDGEYICLKMNRNPFSCDYHKCYMYYNFISKNTVVLNNGPKTITLFERALLRTYGCYKAKSDENIVGVYKINPFICFETADKADTLIAFDTVTGEEYEVSQFAYEAIMFMDKLSVTEAEERLLEANIFSQHSYEIFLDSVKVSRLLISY